MMAMKATEIIEPECYNFISVDSTSEINDTSTTTTTAAAWEVPSTHTLVYRVRFHIVLLTGKTGDHREPETSIGPMGMR